jgi:hypothetical protein
MIVIEKVTSLSFRVLEMRDCAPQEWLRFWSGLYPFYGGYDEREYKELIDKHTAFAAEDIRRIGKWKDGATTEKQWGPNVAQVAYEIWEQAAKELPKCPDELGMKAFLDNWSDRTYVNIFKSRAQTMHFGPPRATTLLHFLSGGSYPIFDSRVRTAIVRLRGRPEIANTVDAYLNDFVPLVRELCAICEAKDCRALDQALFSYGALDERTFHPTQK